MYVKPKPMLRYEDGTEKYRNEQEVLEAIPARFQFPSEEVLLDNQQDFMVLQRRISKSLAKHRVAGADHLPPCVKCSPATLFYCQETESECWKFVMYAARCSK